MKTLSAIISEALLLSAFAMPLLHAQAPATLNVDVKQTKAAVSPTLYGLMTEEINYSYDGGLYAELVRNRTFRSDWSGILNWFLVEKGSAAAKISVDNQSGPSAALTTSARLEVTKADANSPAGLINEGYWGMAVRPNSRYAGSFYAKTDAAALPVHVALVADQSGQVLGKASVSVTGAEWKQYQFEMQSGAAAPGAENHVEVTIDRPATLWLQLVSLFPPTYHNRPNGNRPDIMQKLAAMHPSFLRFPGGNYLEGGRIDTRFDWKKMIGPLVDRPTHPTTWSYHSTDGMGLLEFLEWCEDLHMQPLVGIYAGYSLGGQVVKPGPDLDPYVQEGLEEIEYITGGTDTKWGAVRARDGHAAPFTLSYVEIGNEDNFDRAKTYDGRYAQFYKAIKAKYPKIQVIATMPVNGMTPDVVDDHYYKREQGMFAEATHYDHTDRNGPKIFVGEWATREGTPTPNLGAALGDAAFLTGLERNSDVVVMSAYAPLFVNVNPGGMQWSSDLIGYDALTSYGSPSYYTQVMFASCLGDHTVNSAISGAGDKFFYSVTTSPGKLCMKLVNATSTAQPLAIALNGIGAGAHTAKIDTLRANSVWATNTITRPERIVPVRSTAAVTGEHMQHVMPPYSVQVVELDWK
ncbi:MAG TPA: alpha-L-arabinofuranosidase C-terminal domain-containing protein [Candidatus Sulfopaludibacter sp.]|jgi:alpha-N-arabinofuranosidase|nr:alpha-L-arabinofuranosidase C-terminal domain-containing protein [Candidatus Sulfopaludibacter sp.]